MDINHTTNLVTPVINFGQSITEASSNVTATSTTTLNCTNSVFNITLSASITTLAFSNVPASGRAYSATLVVTQSGGFAITWPASVKWPGNAAPTVTTTASKVDIFTLMTLDMPIRTFPAL